MRHDDAVEALAPHVEQQWRERFMTEVTLRGASVASGADALVEVETHCRESGRSAQEVFGCPATYASDLDLHDAPAWTRAQIARTGAKIALFVAGVWAAMLGAPALAAGKRAQVDAAAVVSMVATIVMMAVLMLAAKRVLRVFVDHRAWFVIGFLAVVTVVPLVGVPFTGVVLATAAAAPTLAAGVVATAVSLVWTLAGIRANSALGDPRGPSSAPAGTTDR